MINLRLILLFLIVLVQTKSISQAINLEKIQSSYFNKLTNEFVFFSGDSLHFMDLNANLTDSKYISNHDELLNFDIYFNEEYFLVHNNGGLVYKLIDDEFTRIDNSFIHKNQYKSSTFVYDGIIYRFGGYGFFDVRNFIIYYSENSNEWEVLKTQSKLFPPRLSQNKYFIYNNELHIFGGYSLDENNRDLGIPNDEYWIFSFENKSWSKIGEHKLFRNLSYSNFDFYHDGKFYYLGNDSIEEAFKSLFSIDLKSRTIKEYEYNYNLGKANYKFPALISNDTLYSVSTLSSSPTSRFNLINIPIESLKQKRISKFDNYIFHYFIFFIVVFTIIYFIKNKHFFEKKLKLKNNFLIYGFFKKIKISEFETFYLTELLNYEQVDNSILLDLIDSNLDISQKTRIKSSLIETINIKLSILTSNKFSIKKVPSNEDKRIIKYKLVRTFNSKFL